MPSLTPSPPLLLLPLMLLLMLLPPLLLLLLLLPMLLLPMLLLPPPPPPLEVLLLLALMLLITAAENSGPAIALAESAPVARSDSRLRAHHRSAAGARGSNEHAQMNAGDERCGNHAGAQARGLPAPHARANAPGDTGDAAYTRRVQARART